MRYAFVLAAALLALSACDSVLDTNPQTSVPSDEAIETPQDAEAALRGAYSALQLDDLYGQAYVVFQDLYADDLDHTGTFQTFADADARTLFADNVQLSNTWDDFYSGVNRANSLLAALEGLEGLSDGARDRLHGEALFVRALLYFDLARYFGGVPIVLEPTTLTAEIERPARATLEEVYDRVETDLVEADALVPASNAAGRATSGAAVALLVRLYLEQGRWSEAAEQATRVIEGPYVLVDDYALLFENQNTAEAILELQFSTDDPNSHAFWFFPRDLGGRREYAPSEDLFAAFEEGDERLPATIGIYDGALYGQKYSRVANGDDHVFVLRLAEMYLARAEALARLGGPVTAVQADLNTVRARAGLPDTEAATIPALLDAILHERRVELALEGQRFFDLRRFGRAQDVLGLSEERLVFPIPQAELDVNPNLEQNPGYGR